MKRPKLERCSCDEARAYRLALIDVRQWLFDLGANGKMVGPMNGDDGAKAIYRGIDTVIRAVRK